MDECNTLAMGIAGATMLPCAVLQPHAAADGNLLEVKSRLYNLATVAGGAVLAYLGWSYAVEVAGAYTRPLFRST